MLSMGGLKRCVVGFTILCCFAQADAAPMQPGEQSVVHNFSPEVRSNFVLLADTDDPTLIYYIPRYGGVAVQAPQSAAPLPRFQIFSRIPSWGFFAGAQLVHLGGSLSTMNALGALRQFQDEAARYGLRTAPAPVERATTRFLATGYQIDSGRLDVRCTARPAEPGSQIIMPHCVTRQSPDEEYDSTNLMYKFTAFTASSQSVISQNIPFQAVTTPDWVEQLRMLMDTGGQWDNTLSARIDWVIKTSSLTRQARLHVNWRTLFQRATAFASVRAWSCVDSEVRYFFEQLIQCNQENACGIRIEYLQPDNTWGPNAPHDSNFVNAVNAVERRLKDELFNELRQRIPPSPSPSPSAGRSFFTLRANYEKLYLERNEVIYFTWNPGPTDFNVYTDLNITCLKGGFESGRVTWDMENPGCRNLLGQQ